MAARLKTDIVAEARAIAKCFGISTEGEHIGDAGAEATGAAMTYEQAMIRLMLLQLELLSNIRQSETNP